MGWRPDLVTREFPRTLPEYARGLEERAQPDGDKFLYRTVLTDVLGMVLERATGTSLAGLLEDALWSRLGAQHDASIVVDRIGFPYVGAGMTCCVSASCWRMKAASGASRLFPSSG